MNQLTMCTACGIRPASLGAVCDPCRYSCPTAPWRRNEGPPPDLNIPSLRPWNDRHVGLIRDDDGWHLHGPGCEWDVAYWPTLEAMLDSLRAIIAEFGV